MAELVFGGSTSYSIDMWSVIGHEKNKKYFETVLKMGVLSHAYIFSGLEMIGKKMFAQDLYKFINKRDQISDSDFDYKLISPRLAEDETKIYIEDIREIKSFLSLKPNIGPYKFIVIDNAHCLTPEGSNALLKILEEPPPFSVLILVTSMPRLLPDTILSRCQSVRFLSQNKETAELIRSKKLKKDDEEFLLKTSAGRIGWMIKTLESGEINTAEMAVEDLRKLLRQGIFERMQYAKKLFESQNYISLVNYWLDWIHSSMKERIANQESLMANRAILKELLKLHQIISQPQFNHRLALENFLINL